MTAAVRATAGEAFDLTLATSPSLPGRQVRLSALYGTDGDPAGADEGGTALSFPVDMDEGLDGVYSCRVLLEQTGPYWARFTVDGVEVQPAVVRVCPAGFPALDARAGIPHEVAVVASPAPSSLQLTVTDREGELAGVDESGEQVAWPQAMAQVPGYPDSWYYDSVTLTEGGRYQMSLAPTPGSIRNHPLSVHADPEVPAGAHRAGWEPDGAIDPSAWVTIGYVRRWTGWADSSVGAEVVRELRRHAIATWIDETGMWVPPWSGTFHSLPAQGRRAYLPCPIVLPARGGDEPTVEQRFREGEQGEGYDVDLDGLAFRSEMRDAKQPHIEYVDSSWDEELGVTVTGTFGLVGPGEPVPLDVKQAIVGLMRWHALSYGTDGADAAGQSRSNRIASESTRDSRVEYHQSSVGQGLTGDRQVDRTIAKYRVELPPWASKCGPIGGRR